MTLLLSLSDILYTFSDTLDFFISIVYVLIYVSSYILVCISLLPESLWPLIILPICLPGSSVVKNPLANAGGIGDAGSNPGSERFTEGGNGNPLQYSFLENPMERGSWQVTVYRVAKSCTPLSDWAESTHRTSHDTSCEKLCPSDACFVLLKMSLILY